MGRGGGYAYAEIALLETTAAESTLETIEEIYPRRRFSSAIRTTNSRIASAFRGRPGLRAVLESYFWATHLRCHRSKV